MMVSSYSNSLCEIHTSSGLGTNCEEDDKAYIIWKKIFYLWSSSEYWRPYVSVVFFLLPDQVESEKFKEEKPAISRYAL